MLVAIALLSAFCFALALVLTRFGLRSTPPLAGAAISVPTTALVFALAAPFIVEPAEVDAGSAVIFALVGLFFPIGVTLLTYGANRHLGPSVAGALGNLSPLIAVAGAVLLLDEVPGPHQALGLLIVVAGVALIALGRGRAAAAPPAWAYALPIAAALLRGVVQPAVKLGLETWPDPFAAATIGYAVSAVIALSARALLTPKRARAPLTRDALWFIGVGLTNGMAVFTLYAALALGPVSLVAPLVASYPLATVALDRMLGGGRDLSRLALAGIGATVLGLALLLSA